MKKLISIICFILIANMALAQNYNVNQNQQNININVPVIEKPVYIEKYRTVYIERPKIPKQLSEPIVLLGYLTVFPRDIGFYNSHPHEIIRNINKQNMYNKNNWRIPTSDELKLMESYADEIGLGTDIYMATSHANGQLRLVSAGVDENSPEGLIQAGKAIKVGNLLWSTVDYGADSPHENGITMDYSEERDIKIPIGWRLPTFNEMKILVAKSSGIYDMKKRKLTLSPVTLSSDAYISYTMNRPGIKVTIEYICSDAMFYFKYGSWFNPTLLKEERLTLNKEFFSDGILYDAEKKYNGSGKVRFVKDL